MKPDMDLLLRTSEHEELYPGKVCATIDKGYTAVFEGRAISLVDGAEVLVFYEINHSFMQQPVRVLSVVGEKQDDDGTRITLELETTGDPVPAETRECYRVSCYAADVKAQLGEDPETCEVLDVSATGFAIVSGAEYSVGQTLQATLYHNGTPVQGKAVVQSYRAFGKQNRYGFRVVYDERPTATLKKDLSRINLVVQREQAARLSGNL
jgi:hypothetical protein